jgi:hypothetical protein
MRLRRTVMWKDFMDTLHRPKPTLRSYNAFFKSTLDGP